MARRAAWTLLVMVIALAAAVPASASTPRPRQKAKRHRVTHPRMTRLRAAKRKARPRKHPAPQPVARTPISTPATAPALNPATPAPSPVLSAPTGSPAALGGGLVVGLNANAAGWGGASTAGRLDLVTGATGTKWLREEFDWATVEPQPGVFDFSYYDHFMQLAAQRGLHILAVLYDPPAWAAPAYNAIPGDPSAFAQYAAAMVGRYGANGSFWSQNPSLKGSAIHTWEVWNEPYLGSGDNGVYDPGRYARLVKAAATAARGVDPTAKFLLAAEMQSGRDANGNWQWWVDALYQAVPDLGQYYDGVAMHDYGNDTSTLNPIIPGQPYNNYGHIRRIEDLRQQFIAHAADKPFWITEAGWSTCTDSPTCVTPAEQATNLATLFNYIHHDWSSWIQAAFIYTYGDGANPTSTQGGYGLTNLNGTPKPALAIFQQEAAGSA